MKRTLLALLVCLIGAPVFANIIYVKASANGDGSTWNQAISDLTRALATAKNGDEIWVAAGVYTPGDQREATFHIPDGVQLLGGFQGTETSAQARRPDQYKTVLSGEVGTPDFADNVYSVVTTVGVSESTLIDGFIISGGVANSDTDPATPQRCGGGWFNDGSKQASSPTILHCIFENNYARDGGAFYNHGQNGTSNPAFQNCTFRQNLADLDGGAVYNNGRDGGQSNPVFANCEFIANEGSYGGAIFSQAQRGESSPKLLDCTLRENIALIRGGGVYQSDTEGISDLTMENCGFEGNYPDDSNRIYRAAEVLQKYVDNRRQAAKDAELARLKD